MKTSLTKWWGIYDGGSYKGKKQNKKKSKLLEIVQLHKVWIVVGVLISLVLFE